MIHTWHPSKRTKVRFALSVLNLCLIIQACDEKPPNGPLNTAVTDSAAVIIIPRSDSTSHSYTWRTWIFGDTPSSSWWDVSAIGENNAIVVGHVQIRDSVKSQHAARWDGSEWRFFTVYMQHNELLYVEPDSIVLYASNTIHQVWGEPPNGWTFSNGKPIYYDGTSFVTEFYFHRHPDSASASQIWGDEADRWYYGVDGKITHASGRKYVLQPTVTSAHIESMAANKHEAWAVSLRRVPGTVLHYSGGIWRNWTDHPAVPLHSTAAVWCDDIGMRPGGTVVMVGKNIVQYDTSWINVTRPLVDFMPRLRSFRCVHGTGRNNIWAAGDYGSVAHFNGNTWVRYPELAAGPELHFSSVWVLDKHVFLVGQRGYQAIIVMGTRVD